MKQFMNVVLKDETHFTILKKKKVICWKHAEDIYILKLMKPYLDVDTQKYKLETLLTNLVSLTVVSQSRLDWFI